ncbi:unnamed protein product, partial [Rotaria sp. Silwood2]
MPTIAYIFVVLSIVAFANTELVRPGYGFVRPQEPCVDKCSPQNDSCKGRKKCCYTPLKPCGYSCLIPKDNVAKNGTCPLPSSEQNHQYPERALQQPDTAVYGRLRRRILPYTAILRP